MAVDSKVIVRLTKRHKRALWGQTHFVKPALVSEVFGDGNKLFGLTMIATRPDYYIIQGDSNWVTSNYDDGDNFCDHLEEIFDAIEEQFGMGEGPRGGYRPFPALHEGDGCSWFEFDEDDMKAT